MSEDHKDEKHCCHCSEGRSIGSGLDSLGFWFFVAVIIVAGMYFNA